MNKDTHNIEKLMEDVMAPVTWFHSNPSQPGYTSKPQDTDIRNSTDMYIISFLRAVDRWLAQSPKSKGVRIGNLSAKQLYLLSRFWFEIASKLDDKSSMQQTMDMYGSIDIEEVADRLIEEIGEMLILYK